MSERSDENLVVASCAGDNGAYAVLAKRYYKCVFVVCLGMLGSVHDAEDIAQETMLKGLINIRDLRDSSQFGSWIIRIAKNHCNNLIHRIHRRKRANELITQKSVPSGQTLIPYKSLQQAIEKLPQETRLPLVMYYFGSESVKEVAEKLNMSRSGVYQRLKTATKELHKLLIKQGDVI